MSQKKAVKNTTKELEKLGSNKIKAQQRGVGLLIKAQHGPNVSKGPTGTQNGGTKTTKQLESTLR